MKVIKKVLLVVVLGLFIVSLAACNSGNGPTKTPPTPPPTTGDNLSSKDVKAISDLTDYGAKASDYNKEKTAFDAGAKSFAGKDCSVQLEKLQKRIKEKHDDVISGDSTASFVKIFALSSAEGIMERMANAALTYDEMNRVVDYLSGTVDADVGKYLEYTEKNDISSEASSEEKDEAKIWSGIFSTGAKWRDEKVNGKQFNEGWSFFDDWELYDRLEDYADTKGFDEDTKNLAEDNAAWQYRSILKKVYEEVNLPGNAAARLATHLLDYAVLIVENKSGGKAVEAITEGSTELGDFAKYCKAIPSPGDPFSGLKDYDTLSYLLAFNEYYGGSDGLISCVRLYGYYYDYNKRYYEKSLKDEETYAKQLKYEKMSVFTDDEWLDYVDIQRNNYINAYRYTTEFYRTFYTNHFKFQGIIESYDEKVYEMTKTIRLIGAEDPGTTYTKEMRNAINKGTVDGLAGQLAMSDWTWCYGGSETYMKAYNKANTKYENAKGNGAEPENEGKFYYEMEQLKFVKYLLEKMEDNELSGALYYQVYAYSASMVKKMQDYVKNIVYITDKIEVGAEYTNISSTAQKLEKSNEYAKEKINVIYGQAYSNWATAAVGTKAKNVTSQPWNAMEDEIDAALEYDYLNMEIVNGKKGEWEQRVERLEDLVIAKKYSCCGQKVSEADTTKCSHGSNPDGTIVTKEYDTDHKISAFVSNYEEILFHIAGQSNVSFQTPVKTDKELGYQTKVAEAGQWKAGYDGNIDVLRKNVNKSMIWEECQAYTIDSGEQFSVAVEDAEEADKNWWNREKVGTTSTEQKDRDYPKKGAENGIEVSEKTDSGDIVFVYKYEFVGWYLDKDAKYEFDEDDEVDINLKVYAGYNVTKTKKD